VQLAPAGIRVKGVPYGDNFIWGPEEAVRNLYHDQSFADRILALTPTEAQMDVMLPEIGQIRLAGAARNAIPSHIAATKTRRAGRCASNPSASALLRR